MTRLLALTSMLAIGLAGCASTSQQQAADESSLDRMKIAAVERAAARVGVGVYWVNAPRKPSQ